MNHLSKSGPSVGTFLGKPIFKNLTDESSTYIFDRVAPYNEGWSPQQLSRNELLLEPGLIYKRCA